MFNFVYMNVEKQCSEKTQQIALKIFKNVVYFFLDSKHNFNIYIPKVLMRTEFISEIKVKVPV